MFSTINIEKLLKQAEAKQAEQHAEAEVAKLGILRGGSTGIVTAEGEIHGTCHRVALARYLGIDSPVDDRSPFFFSAGHLNEERWAELLAASQASQGWSGVFLREQEVPTKWQARTPSGKAVDVTGSPDILLVNPDADYKAPTYNEAGKVVTPALNFTPLLLLELKKVCSSYRAEKVFISVKPDAKHLTQAAHYSWQHKFVPGILSYTSDSSYDTPYWAIKKFGADRKIPPGRQHFYFGWQDGFFCYIHPTTAQVVKTLITAESIERFYTLVLGMEELKDLGPRPVDGPIYEGQSDDPCKYCAFASACTSYDQTPDYQEWVDQTRLISKEGKE